MSALGNETGTLASIPASPRVDPATEDVLVAGYAVDPAEPAKTCAITRSVYGVQNAHLISPSDKDMVSLLIGACLRRRIPSVVTPSEGPKFDDGGTDQSPP